MLVITTWIATRTLRWGYNSRELEASTAVIPTIRGTSFRGLSIVAENINDHELNITKYLPNIFHRE
jgi:hypothetical protein